ncbi:MAG: dTDP-4-dehydrorhamnose reductase [Fibrobacteres bacterium]|nr:dTDP-4-dehydrorhamnose reductase [Fibrobacterota bacterium]
MKALIIGCNGLLGQNLLLTRPSSTWEVFGAGLEKAPGHPALLSGYQSVDISRREDLDATIKAVAPDWIFNAAAITDVDLCERDPALAGLINRDTVGWMADHRIPMVHVSTDYVFDGEAGPYLEDAPTRPLSVYGSTKLESERLVLSRSGRSLIVRTMTLWGRGKGAKTSFVDFVRDSLKAGKTIRIVTDQWGNATLAEDLALGIWNLVEGGHAGVFHVAGSEWNSRFEWAQAIADHYGLDRGLIQSCLTADLKQAARRPLKSGLRTDKLTAATGFRPRNIAGQIRRMDELSQSIT